MDVSDVIDIGQLSPDAYRAIEDYAAEKNWPETLVRNWIEPASLLLLIELLKRTEDSVKVFPKGKSATIQHLQEIFESQFTTD